MSTPIPFEPDPSLDLLFDRTVDLSPELIWNAWTTPALLEQWFAPKPWRTTDCVIDLRPGGAFRTTMRGPDGEVFENEGCYLEVISNERLIWTGSLKGGYRPNVLPSADDHNAFQFTAVITLGREGNATKYRALLIHADEAGRDKHEAMGFQEGWGAAFDQLVALIKP